MAPGSGSADFPVMIPKVAQADWSYHGDEWLKGSSDNTVDESGNCVFGLERNASLLSASCSAAHEMPGFNYASYGHTSSKSSLVGGTNGYCWDFENRLSALLQNNLRLSTPDPVNAEIGSSVQSSRNHQFDFSELEWQTIGSLLPDDDELLSSIVPDLDGSATANFIGENEELDLFSSGGGLELEGDAQDLSRGPKKSVETLSRGGAASGVGEHPFGEHPSRTLFVRNINSSVEDAELRVLFEQYGDIRTLYTACKHRGFVMISYYDIRAARSAMRALQNKALRRRKLDIHFSIPKDNPSDKDVNQGTLVVFNVDASVSNNDLRQIFGVYGEVKEIRETPHKQHHKFIEFYDVRSAEAALRALNRCDIAGKRIKLEHSRPGGARRSVMQHLTHELEQEENFFFREHGSSPLTKSAPVQVDMMDSLDKGPAVEACLSLGYTGLGMQPTPHPPLNTFSGFGNGIMEPVQYSPSAALSALKARALSDHLLKMGAASFNNMSLFESSNGVHLLTPSSHTRSMESLPVHELLCSSLNSLYHKDGPSALWPSSPVGPSYGIGGFGKHSSYVDVGSHTHLLAGAISSPHHHHVESVPITAFPLLNRHQACYREPFDVSSLSMASNSVGAAVGVGRRHSMESHTSSSLSGLTPSILSNGSVDDGSYPNLWLMAQQQSKGNPFSKAVHDVSPVASEWVMERGRGRKTDNAVSQHDRKQYELDIERILRGEDMRTTLMLKNIPNKYTSKMLLAAIDEHHKGTYDFIYLPIDFKNKCNVGYAFINMTESSRIVPFYQAFNGKRWEKFNSEKVASLAYARIQGKAALISHFQNSSLMNEDKRCRPILFHSGGPNVGDQEPFPVGANPRMRLSKTRGSAGAHQGSPIRSNSKEKLSSGF